MKALTVTKFGEHPQMAVEVGQDPKPGAGEALVRVRAAAVNPLDLTVRAGRLAFAKQPPLVLGNEGAGVVEFSSRFPQGSRVMVSGGFLGIGEDGTQRELMAVPEERLVPLPETFSFAEGAAFPVAYLTAYLALTHAGNLKEGNWVAIAGAAGSVGHAAVQVARALGARPIAVVSSAEKAERVAGPDPAGVINLAQEGLPQGVARISQGRGADVGIDPVGGPVTGPLLQSLAAGGRIVSIGYTAGVEATVSVLDLIGKQARLIGFSLFAVPGDVVAAALQTVIGWAEAGTVRPAVDSTFPLERAEDAFARLASRKAVGKVVLTT